MSGPLIDDRGAPTYPPPEPEGPVHPIAVASLVLSIVWLAGAGSILALVFGYRARREVARDPWAHTGSGIAALGIAIGWIGLVGAVLVTVLAFRGYDELTALAAASAAQR